MKICRLLFLLCIAQIAIACASPQPKPLAEPGVDQRVIESRLVDKRKDAGPETGGDRGTVAAQDNSDARADDIDPWEGFNRKSHAVNNTLDKYLVRPVAKAYDAITPEPVQAGVTKFFGNLREPSNAVNQVLQGSPSKAGRSVGRFVVNTTIGIGGIFDPATSLGLSRESTDLGQTFAKWGWHDSRYLVLPFFGPGTVRDTAGVFGGQRLSATSRIQNSMVSNGLTLLQMTNGRAQLLATDDIRSAALDDYIFVRDAWMKKRSSQLSETAASSQSKEEIK